MFVNQDAEGLFRAGFDQERIDPQAARRLYEQAASLGSTHAMVNLGLMLRDSEPDAARRYYGMAAQLGDRRAMYNLAISTAKTDPDTALELLRKAKEAGEPNATRKAFRHLKYQKRMARLTAFQGRLEARLIEVKSPDGRPFRVQVVKGNIASREFYWPWEDALRAPSTWSVVVVDTELARRQRRQWNPEPSTFYVTESHDKTLAMSAARSIADRIIVEGWPLRPEKEESGD